MFFKKKSNTSNHITSAIVLAVMIVVAVGFRIWQFYHVPTIDVSLDGKKLHLMLADTPARQFLGLGKKDSLGIYDGMLFVFPDARAYGFVMRDMRFPLDIVWLHDGIVVDIAPKVQTEIGIGEDALRKYYPRDIANVVIELPSGWSERHGLKIGDQLITL